MRTAEEVTVLLRTVADDATAAMFAARRKGMDRTFETVEGESLAVFDDVE
jgi:hypothetical protein